MPFSVFRKHQRKMLAILAILAMFSFVLSDSLSSWIPGSGAGRGENPVVAKLKWKTLRASDLEPMRLQRGRANYFVYQVLQQKYGPNPQFAQVFGGTSTRDLVDAIILEHEADRLGMPATPDIANKWLRQQTQDTLNARFFEDIYRRSSLPGQVTDVQLLAEIANQIRIGDVRRLPDTAEVTPLDVFQAYRDQNEKVSVFAVPVRVDEFLSEVPEPSEAEVAAVYEAGKNLLPDPARPNPGFLIPKRVKFEFISADVNELAAKILPTLTTEELRATYELRPDEFPAPPGELPLSIFAGAPDLTKHDAFPEVKDRVAQVLAQEKAQEEINSKFYAIKNDKMREFEDEYYAAEENEAKASASSGPKPNPGDLLKTTAAAENLTYEATPLVPSTDPSVFGPIRESRLGTSPSNDQPLFEDLAFSTRTKLYDPLELTDRVERRYLAWKVEDEPAKVPSLDQVRADVIKAWKLAKARPLAEAEARKIAEAAAKAEGADKIKAQAGERPVIITDPRPRITSSLISAGRSFGAPRATEITELPLAGEKLREAIYSLQPGGTAVAPNSPEDVYYALALRERNKTEVASLYEVGLGRFMLDEVRQEAAIERMRDWMNTLRTRAGLPPDWAPEVDDRNNGDELADSL